MGYFRPWAAGFGLLYLGCKQDESGRVCRAGNLDRIEMDASVLTMVPCFRQLGHGQLQAVLERSTMRREGDGSVIFHEGDDAERFYLLLDGAIRVLRIMPDGEQAVTLHILPGELFGIASAIGRKTYPATAAAVGDCVYLSWPMPLWAEFAETCPGFAVETFHEVGNRLVELNTTLTQFATKLVEQRVACALLRLVEKFGSKTHNATAISIPVTRKDIAEMSGSTLHTVSRLLSGWEKDGIVSSRRKHVEIIDVPRLSALAKSG